MNITFDDGDKRIFSDHRACWERSHKDPNALLHIWAESFGRPDTSGQITAFRLEPEFVEYLTSMGFPFGEHGRLK
jgi:hypothetical protein